MLGTLYTYRYRHPAYGRVDQVLDCYALCAPRALKSAQRFLRRENRHLKQCGAKVLIRVPNNIFDLRWEG
jgi:hypothetical protein